MAILMYASLLLFVNVHMGIGKTIREECGTLTIEPPVKNRRVTFTFVPTKPSTRDRVSWWRSTPPGGWKQFSNSTNNTFYKKYSIYYLLLAHSTDTTYFVDLNGMNGNCRIKTQLKELNDCGIVYQRTARVIAGSPVQLGYLPPQAVYKHPTRYVRHWLYTLDTCLATTDVCTYRNITGLYIERKIESNMEFVLTIPNMNSSMNGFYTVQCTAGRSEDKRANGTTIQSLSPPGKPMFVNTSDFEDCKQCIQGIHGKASTIGCYTRGGSEPVTVNIYVAKTRINIKGRIIGGAYMTSWQFNERDHLHEVKCEVSNTVATTPLVVVSKLYVMQLPQKPELKMNILREGQPIDVSCTSKGGRPVGNILIYISNNDLPSNSLTQSVQTNILDSNGTFTSTKVLKTIEREWNGRYMVCCVSHEALVNHICNHDRIDFKFPPASVTIHPPQRITEDRHYHLLNVSCVITNANPPCPAVWNFQDMAVLTSTQYNKTTNDNGHSTTNVAVVNVSKADSGKYIECRAGCTEFHTQKSDTYQLYVPYAPVIELNVSTSTINVTEGTTVLLQCAAKSDPVSTISWITSNSNSSFTELACGGSGTMCMHITDIKLGDSGLYTCRADNSFFGTKTKDIEIKAIEHPQDYDQENKSDNEQSSSLIVWSVVGASIFAVVCITLGFVIKRVVRKTSDDIDRAGDLNCSVQFAENNDSDVNRTPGNATAAFAFNDDEGPTYATVIPLSQRHAIPSDKHEALKSNQPSKELIYVDLDLQPSRSGIRRRTDSPTEYVSIDFTKKFHNYQCDSSP